MAERRAVCDALGRPVAIEVTPGQIGDVRAAAGLLAQLPPARQCAADIAYDSDALRQVLRERGTRPVIPNNPTRKRFHAFNLSAYKHRNVIERAFCRLKDWRRVATRYDKLARNFHLGLSGTCRRRSVRSRCRLCALVLSARALRPG